MSKLTPEIIAELDTKFFKFYNGQMYQIHFKGRPLLLWTGTSAWKQIHHARAALRNYFVSSLDDVGY